MGRKWEESGKGRSYEVSENEPHFPLISHKVVHHIVITPGATVIAAEEYRGTVCFFMDPGLAMVRV